MLKRCYPKNAKVLSRILLRPYQRLGQPMAAGPLALPESLWLACCLSFAHALYIEVLRVFFVLHEAIHKVT